MKWVLIIFFGSALLYGILKPLIEAYKQVQTEELEAERVKMARANEAKQEHEFQETIRYLLRSGKKMDAIKECKDHYHCSLSKAKTILSEFEFEMEYERTHGENYRPYAHGRARRKENTRQSTQDSVTDTLKIDGMDGHKFEYFCAELLLKNGFDRADVTKGSGDQGVDIIAVKDGVKYAIQCKNYKTVLSNTPIQEVNAGKQFYDCHVGVVMTNSTFTSGAQKLADKTGVLLWDRAYVENLIKKAGMDEEIINDIDTKSCHNPDYGVKYADNDSGSEYQDLQILKCNLENKFSQQFIFNVENEECGYYKISKKNKKKALLLCIFFGYLGIHRFYLGKVGTGIIWLLTYGCLGAGWIVDIILILTNHMKDSTGYTVCGKSRGKLDGIDVLLLEINYWMNRIVDPLPEDLMTAIDNLISDENGQFCDDEINNNCEKLFRYCCKMEFLSSKYKESCYQFFKFVLSRGANCWSTEESFLESNQKLRGVVSDSSKSIAKLLDNIVFIVSNNSCYNYESKPIQMLLYGRDLLDQTVRNIDNAKSGFDKMKMGVLLTDD